jgi:3-hydroxyacyl-[acyl-carrier-protein] dehydratase
MDGERKHRVDVARDHPAFAGHFPGRPMLPGVALLAEAMEAAAADPALVRAIGPAPRLSVVKFLAPVGPGERLEIALSLEARAVAFEVFVAERIAASGRFSRADLGPESAQ